ncbi:MAG: MoaD/ThiS family protein [Phycisphaeraceae bacterium]|nr:MoaD/ThiS family protein [Phycisphaeraceae bacterium]
MNVRVLLFGPYADAAGADALTLAFPERDEVTAGEVLAAIRTEYPPMSGMLSAAILAVNERRARPEQPVRESDECVIIGLVGGG